jgi:hypothetical protein
LHESYQPVAGLLSEITILTDFTLLLLVLATDKPVGRCSTLRKLFIRLVRGEL